MLSFENVSCSFGGRCVLRDFSLQVRPGELAVMLGPSGVGKTTILRLAAGLIQPSGGCISNRFQTTSMVFQEPRLLPWLPAWENVSLVLQDFPEKKRQAMARLWLGRMGLSSAEHERLPAELSGGQRQRVAIARAFAMQPDLILMDEPFAALDLGARQGLQNLTRRLAGEVGTAILFVTHDVPEAVRLADRLLMIAGAPGMLLADLPHRPIASPDAVWLAAAHLVRRPEFAPLLRENMCCNRDDNCSVMDNSEINTTISSNLFVA